MDWAKAIGITAFACAVCSCAGFEKNPSRTVIARISATDVQFDLPVLGGVSSAAYEVQPVDPEASPLLIVPVQASCPIAWAELVRKGSDQVFEIRYRRGSVSREYCPDEPLHWKSDYIVVDCRAISSSR